MPGTEPIRHHADVDKACAIQVTAIYQRDGAVALIRSESFDPMIELHELLSWAKDFEELGIEFIRLEIDPTKGRGVFDPFAIQSAPETPTDRRASDDEA